MITVNSPWRTLGKVSYDQWMNELWTVASPITDEGRDAWRAAGDHSALCLGMLREESQYATAFNRNRPRNFNPLNLRPPDGDGYLAFRSYTDGIRAWAERITDPAYKGGVYGRTQTIRDLIGVYAPGTDSNDPDAYAAGIVTTVRRIVGDQEGPSNVSTPRIILNPGHRNSTGGNAEEASWTPALASAYFDAFSAAGFETINLGDTNGGLDATCVRMAQAIDSAPGACVLLDLHYEGSPVPGVFAIVPDVTGLTTGAPVAQSPADTWENNGKDREVADNIVTRIAQATGLAKRTSGVRLPGLMDESQTGVGGDGYRLATFAYTSPYHAKAVRLVVEHGNHTINPDRQIILTMGPTTGFPQACANAAVAAVIAIYGKPQSSASQPAPIWWMPGKDVGLVKRPGDGHVANAMLVQTYATTTRAVPVYDQIGGKKIGEIGASKPAVIVGTTRDDKGRGWNFVKWGDDPARAARARASSFQDKLPLP